MRVKRKQTKFTFDTYCRAIDRCLAGISEAHIAYDKAMTVNQGDKARNNMVYWSKLNLLIVKRRNRELLGM